MPAINAEIAVYKGDNLLCIGTLRQCAKTLRIRPQTLNFYTTPTYQRRVAKRSRTSGNIRAVVKL